MAPPIAAACSSISSSRRATDPCFPALTLQRKGRELALQLDGSHLRAAEPEGRESSASALKPRSRFELPRFARVLHFRAYLRRCCRRGWPRRLRGRSTRWIAFCIGARPLLVIELRRVGQRFRQELRHALGRGRQERPVHRPAQPGSSCAGGSGRSRGHTFDVLAIRSRRDGSLRAYFVCDRSGEALSVADCLSIGSEDGARAEPAPAEPQGPQARHGLGKPSHTPACPRWSRALLRAGFRVRSSQIFFAVMDPSLAARSRSRTPGISRGPTRTS